MIWTLIFIVIGIALIAGALGAPTAARPSGPVDNYGRRVGPSSNAPIVVWIGAVVAFVIGLLFFIAAFGWTEIGPGQVGVVINLGQVQDTPLYSGLNWRMPLVTKIDVIDARVQSYKFGGDPQGDLNNPANQGIETFTFENQPAYMYGIVNYHIDPAFATTMVRNVGDDWFDKLVVSQAQAEIKQDARIYTVDNITKQRDALAKGAQDRLSADVAPYHITIDSIYINNVRLSADYLAAVTAKQIALQQLSQANTQADIVRATAHGAADAVAIAADGQAKANAAIAQSITPGVLEYLTITKLAPNVQIALLPAGNNFIIDPRQLLGGASPSPSALP